MPDVHEVVLHADDQHGESFRIQAAPTAVGALGVAGFYFEGLRRSSRDPGLIKVVLTKDARAMQYTYGGRRKVLQIALEIMQQHSASDDDALRQAAEAALVAALAPVPDYNALGLRHRSFNGHTAAAPADADRRRNMTHHRPLRTPNAATTASASDHDGSEHDEPLRGGHVNDGVADGTPAATAPPGGMPALPKHQQESSHHTDSQRTLTGSEAVRQQHRCRGVASAGPSGRDQRDATGGDRDAGEGSGSDNDVVIVGELNRPRSRKRQRRTVIPAALRPKAKRQRTSAVPRSAPPAARRSRSAQRAMQQQEAEEPGEDAHEAAALEEPDAAVADHDGAASLHEPADTDAAQGPAPEVALAPEAAGPIASAGAQALAGQPQRHGALQALPLPRLPQPTAGHSPVPSPPPSRQPQAAPGLTPAGPSGAAHGAQPQGQHQQLQQPPGQQSDTPSYALQPQQPQPPPQQQAPQTTVSPSARSNSQHQLAGELPPAAEGRGGHHTISSALVAVLQRLGAANEARREVRRAWQAMGEEGRAEVHCDYPFLQVAWQEGDEQEMRDLLQGWFPSVAFGW